MMWIKEAFVVDVLSDGRYKVLFLEHAACKNCGACKGLTGDSEKIAILPSEVKLSKGDVCMVGIDQSKLLKLALLVYLMPILLLFFVMGVSLLIDKNMGWILSPKRAFFMGILAMIFAFWKATKYFDKKFKTGEWGMRIIKKVGG